jgi:hypothetical protein
VERLETAMLVELLVLAELALELVATATRLVTVVLMALAVEAV